MIHFSFFESRATIISILLVMLPVSLFAQDVIAPPSLGQKTQGEPANVSLSTESTQNSDEPTPTTNEPDNDSTSLLGTTQISELRRENGQVYRIKLEHSSGSKQYLDADPADGKINTKSRDIEETPNLAKWRLGSW